MLGGVIVVLAGVGLMRVPDEVEIVARHEEAIRVIAFQAKELLITIHGLF